MNDKPHVTLPTSALCPFSSTMSHKISQLSRWIVAKYAAHVVPLFKVALTALRYTFSARLVSWSDFSSGNVYFCSQSSNGMSRPRPEYHENEIKWQQYIVLQPGYYIDTFPAIVNKYFLPAFGNCAAWMWLSMKPGNKNSSSFSNVTILHSSRLYLK